MYKPTVGGHSRLVRAEGDREEVDGVQDQKLRANRRFFRPPMPFDASHFTVIFPFMSGCSLQWYSKVPALVGRGEALHIGGASSWEPQSPLSEVTVCGFLSSLVHFTVVPTLMLTLCGWKASLVILTALLSVAFWCYRPRCRLVRAASAVGPVRSRPRGPNPSCLPCG